jgi:S-adenosylmethionine:tRNA ribosyltransferase-isomerase
MNKDQLRFENIHPEQYTYTLPEEFVATEPLEDRASSKLLFYKNGEISHKIFKEIPGLLPDNSRLIFNDTKVIAARINAFKPTGAKIEVFLLEPISPSAVMEDAMQQRGKVSWRCMIGNAKKWKINSELSFDLENNLTLFLRRLDEDIVSLDWNNDETFSVILDKVGKVPLPPYINREATELDIPRYQTVYSKTEGAVAAPTAGLHFTDKVLKSLDDKATTDFVTLHVSAGTFQPIKTNAKDHPMHREEVIVSIETIKKLRDNKKNIAVGTTSMRTLESLYWYGVKLSEGDDVFHIDKLYPYQQKNELKCSDSMDQVIKFMLSNNLKQLRGYTEIFIFPGYRFRVCQGLITNFHLPNTTLIMLIAAFVGKDWEIIYQQALENNYRFLSYGDSSLLLPK